MKRLIESATYYGRYIKPLLAERRKAASQPRKAETLIPDYDDPAYRWLQETKKWNDQLLKLRTI